MKRLFALATSIALLTSTGTANAQEQFYRGWARCPETPLALN